MVSLSTPKCLNVIKGVLGWCGLCSGLTMGTPTSKGANVEAVLPRMARGSRDTMGVSGVAMGVPVGWN